MRFTAVAFAGAAAAAGSTILSTEMITITACPSTVTNCPASSTTVSSVVHQVTPSTIYTTTVKTITSCAADVTNCPGKTGYVVTETIPVSTTLCPVTSTKIYGNGTFVPHPPTKSGDKPVPPPTYIPKPPTPGGGEEGPKTFAQPACPTYSVKTISTSITTVVPTVIYETVSIPCPATKPAPTGTGVPVPPKPPVGGNTTIPVKPTTPVTAGAVSLGGSVFLAAAAGLAAAFLA